MSNRTSLPELPSQLHSGTTPPELRPTLRAESSVSALQAILDAFGPPLLLVDDDGRPIFVNRRAAQVLAQRDGLAIGLRGLTTRCSKTTRALRAAIAGAAAHADSAHARSLNVRVSVARQPPRPPWLVSVLPIAGDGTVGYAAISITEFDVHIRIDPTSAADYFLLTPREADVAALLAGGRNLREAARALHIGIGTVRTHLKSLFEKTGVRSQTALALKMQAFAVRD